MEEHGREDEHASGTARVPDAGGSRAQAGNDAAGPNHAAAREAQEPADGGVRIRSDRGASSPSGGGEDSAEPAASVETTGEVGRLRSLIAAAERNDKISGKIEITFGKHRGRRVRNVPADYLLWIYDQRWFQDKFPVLHKYIDQERERLEKEVERGY